MARQPVGKRTKITRDETPILEEPVREDIEDWLGVEGWFIRCFTFSLEGAEQFITKLILPLSLDELKKRLGPGDFLLKRQSVEHSARKQQGERRISFAPDYEAPEIEDDQGGPGLEGDPVLAMALQMVEKVQSGLDAKIDKLIELQTLQLQQGGGGQAFGLKDVVQLFTAAMEAHGKGYSAGSEQTLHFTEQFLSLQQPEEKAEVPTFTEIKENPLLLLEHPEIVQETLEGLEKMGIKFPAGADPAAIAKQVKEGVALPDDQG